MGFKTCTKCGETKPLESFKVDRSKRGGRKQPCKPCATVSSRKWGKANPDRRRMSAVRTERKRRRAIRAEVLIAYGSRCACCGEGTPEFLTVDHINNDGAEHRRALNLKSGANFYRWLKTQGYPQENFQLLCFNCNCAKGLYGACPHKRAMTKGA